MDEKNSFVLRHLSDLQPDLWWLDSDPLEPEAHSSLIGDVGADLCVVGAGYTGLWTALLAKERDPAREVVVLEQYETGAGASGRNGGFCSASLTHGFGNGMQRFASEMPLIEEMGRRNLDEIEETVRRYGIECDFERTGELRVAVEPWQLDGMLEEARLRNEMGDHVEVLSREQVRARIHSPVYEGAIFDPDGTAHGGPRATGVGSRARLPLSRRHDPRELQGASSRRPGRRREGAYTLRLCDGSPRRPRDQRLSVVGASGA